MRALTRFRRLSLILCVINWSAFSIFLLLRQPNIREDYEAMRTDAESVFRPMPSGSPMTHIAGRPLFTWNSWHGGESSFVIIGEVVNAPSLLLANILAPQVGELLFTGSYSYYLESWVKAWLFIAFASGQWIAIAWTIDQIRARLRSRIPPPR
jgi:hypothetical protein